MSEGSKERLQKVMAHAGVASRRKSEDLIVQGRVTVNGSKVTELGTKVDPGRDDIRVDGQRIKIASSNTYIMLNKPRGILSTMEDDRDRPDLSDLLSVPARLYPVGRLDSDSQGLILLTDDGELANLLTHPRYKHEKEYKVLVNGAVAEKTRLTWERGVILEGIPTAPARVDILRKDRHSTVLRIVMREGRKRQIRSVAAILGHPVRDLIRVRLGPLQLGTLSDGKWRYLTPGEINTLEAIKRTARKAQKRKSGKRKR
jgi:23S rRNA pseudouridine2605 synthase